MLDLTPAPPLTRSTPFPLAEESGEIDLSSFEAIELEMSDLEPVELPLHEVMPVEVEMGDIEMVGLEPMDLDSPFAAWSPEAIVAAARGPMELVADSTVASQWVAPGESLVMEFSFEELAPRVATANGSD